MRVLEQAIATAKTRKARVILPETDDPRIVEATRRLEAEGLAQPVALADAGPRPMSIAFWPTVPG